MQASRAFRRRPFTLVEVLFASGLSVMGFAIMVNLFVTPMQAWRESLYKWSVDSQARLVREKMLHSVRNGKNGVGLRSASRTVAKPGSSNKSEWVDFDVDTRTLPVPADNGNYEGWRILWNNGQGLASKDTGAPVEMLPSTVTATKVAFAMPTSSTLTAQVDLQTKWGSRTAARSVFFMLYLVNR